MVFGLVIWGTTRVPVLTPLSLSRVSPHRSSRCPTPRFLLSTRRRRTSPDRKKSDLIGVDSMSSQPALGCGLLVEGAQESTKPTEDRHPVSTPRVDDMPRLMSLITRWVSSHVGSHHTFTFERPRRGDTALCRGAQGPLCCRARASAEPGATERGKMRACPAHPYHPHSQEKRTSRKGRTSPSTCRRQELAPLLPDGCRCGRDPDDAGREK